MIELSLLIFQMYTALSYTFPTALRYRKFQFCHSDTCMFAFSVSTCIHGTMYFIHTKLFDVHIGNCDSLHIWYPKIDVLCQVHTEKKVCCFAAFGVLKQHI